MNRQGFSLIELLTVLTLMALVATIASFKWNEPYQAARFQAIKERIIDADMKLRRHATSHRRRCRILFDIEGDVMQCSRWAEGHEKVIGFKLGSGIQLMAVQTATGNTESGTSEIYVESDGSSETYAVGVQQGSTSSWIAFAGRTGQHHYFSEYSDVETLFKNLQVQGADAN